MAMKLGEIVGEKIASSLDHPEVMIEGLTADSRQVRPGFLFAALPGTLQDGAKYIEQALAQGASAVLTHGEWQKSVGSSVLASNDDVPVFADNNPRRTLALCAARYFSKQPETICAVTGTNGKTSIANFARQIWTNLNLRAASLGTLGLVSPESYVPINHTTPDPVRVHQMLEGLSLARVNHLALEASSHGLAQFRLDGVRIQAAAFTNLTRDHLDYHEDAEDYFYAKLRLFGELLRPGAVAVLNKDADIFSEVEHLCWARGIRILSVGSEGADIAVRDVASKPLGQKVSLTYRGNDYEIDLNLLGSFQASNVLMAAALCIATGSDPEAVFACLPNMRGVPGRMERVGAYNGASIVVDYAHTPDALQTALQSLKPHLDGKLTVIIGCGGDRDKGKRPLMAQIAAEQADQTIITDDNPRSEDPSEIRKEMLAGVKKKKRRVQEIGDRSEAIAFGVKGLGKGDILLIAGKGHESGQIIGDKTLPFNDKDEAVRVISELAGDNVDVG